MEGETSSSHQPKPVTNNDSTDVAPLFVDDDGDLIMSPIEVLVGEQLSGTPTFEEQEPENNELLVASETSKNEMDYIQTFILNTSTPSKFDKRSTRARRQLLKKLDSFFQTDTLAGKQLRAFKKKSHQSSRGRNSQPSVKVLEALTSGAVIIGQSGITTTQQ